MSTPKIKGNPITGYYEDPTEEAFDRSGLYQWQGQDIAWSERHNWLWLKIARANNATTEEDALTAMMIGMGDTDDVKGWERLWRSEQETLFDLVAEFCGRHGRATIKTDDGDIVHGDLATDEALEVFYGQIMPDLQASDNELDAADGGDDASPGKSPAALATSTTSTPLPGSVLTQSSTGSPTHEGSSSSPSSSDPSATNSYETSPPASGSKTSPGCSCGMEHGYHTPGCENAEGWPTTAEVIERRGNIA